MKFQFYVNLLPLVFLQTNHASVFTVEPKIMIYSVNFIFFQVPYLIGYKTLGPYVLPHTSETPLGSVCIRTYLK